MKIIWINEISFTKEVKRLLLLMKITLIILFICIFQLQAIDSYSQTTTLSIQTKEVALEDLFNEIESRSEYLFNYRDSDVSHIKTKVNIVNGNIKDILTQALKNTNLSFSINDRHITIFDTPTIEKEEKKVVSGSVKDNSGELLLGVSIVLKGTSIGTVTDIDGNYSVEVPDDHAILVFSYLGYSTQELSVKGKSRLDVILTEDMQKLEEVVVVGYGTQKKVNLTGAVAQLKGEILENRPVTNITQALQGTVANLNISSTSGGAPGADQTINIRGYTGFGLDENGKMVSKSQSPLIVIDGVQGGDINSINMQDVESISVLKDAASTAIYGSSAPYGVIIINTKKGKKGSKAKITYNNNFGFAQPINLPKMMNSLDFANIYNEAARNGNIAPVFSEENIQRIKDYQSGVLKDETIPDPTPGIDEWQTWTGNGNNDWFDIYFKNMSFSQQHNVGVSGGTDKTNYYVGLGYNQKDGMYNYGDDSYKRYNVRTNLSVDLVKWLSFNMRSSYARWTTDSPDTYNGSKDYMHQIARKWPTAPLKNPDGAYSYPSEIPLHQDGGRDKSTSDQAVLTGEFVITPMTGWNITANYTFDGLFVEETEHVKTLYVTNPSGASTIYSGTTPNSYKRVNSKNQHHIINLFSSYEKQLGDHYFKAMVGYTQELYDDLKTSVKNTDLYSDNLPSLSLTYGKSPSIEDKANQLAIRGGFGRINYNYKEKYLLELNGRYDGTSRFLKDVRYKFYPGASAAWVMSKEDFWKPVEEYVNTFKLRVSYGSLGDQGFIDSYYPFHPSMSTTAPSGSQWIFADGRQAYVSYPGLVNPNLTWVTTSTIDFGVDMTFLNNRLNATFDWYKRSSKDFVGPAEILPSIIGIDSPQMNNSAMNTKGFDLSVSWRDRIGEVNYGVSFVLSDYMSEITSYPNPTGLNTTWYEGRKVGDIWGYETYGVFKSDEEIASAPSQNKIYAQWSPGDIRYVDQNGDDKIDWGDNTLANPGDKKVIGNTTPRFSYGLNLSADYKGFDFSLFLQGIAKRDAWIDSNYFWGIVGDQWQSSVFTVHSDRWTEDNPDGYFPKFYLTSQNNKNTQTQTRYLQNAAYMRIKNMQIGYTFPKSLISKINFERLRVYVSGDNLATFSSMFNTIDPEFSATNGKLYPLQRTWSVGLNVTF